MSVKQTYLNKFCSVSVALNYRFFFLTLCKDLQMKGTHKTPEFIHKIMYLFLHV